MHESEKKYFCDHLGELRFRLIKSAICLFLCFLSLCPFTAPILSFIIQPAGKLVYLHPVDAFTAHMSIAFWGSVLVSSPYIFYQGWQFVSAGLKQSEKKYAVIVGIVSCVLFLAGCSFGYFLILPLAWKCLLQFVLPALVPMITLNNYISFVTTVILIFGLVFQTPLLLLFLARTGILPLSLLVRRRREAIVLIFILAAVLTPPDVFSQILLAVPLWILYEISIVLVKISAPKNRQGGDV